LQLIDPGAQIVGVDAEFCGAVELSERSEGSVRRDQVIKTSSCMCRHGRLQGSMSFEKRTTPRSTRSRA